MLRIAPLVLIALSLGSAHAQHPAPPPDTLVAADYDAFTFVPPRSDAAARRGMATAQFEFDLTGFPPEAEEAFRFAASIWASHLESSVPIQVRASFSELDAQTLGAAGPACVEARPEFPRRNTWYPVALAEALLGRNLNPPGASVCPGVDITATFNSALDVDQDGVIDWYFGTDGNTPGGRYDFVTVVLHELGHGLGFIGTFEVGTDDDEVGCPESLGDIPTGFGCWGIGGGSNPVLPLIFDRFAEDGQGVPLLTESVYPNPSLDLGLALQSDAVVFDGPTAVTSNGTVPINLYAPSNFEPGSTFSHLDESVSPPGDPNSLMTPQLGRAEAIFSPGPFTCAIMSDIGWPLGADCLALLFSFNARVAGQGVEVTFRLPNDAGFAWAIVEQGRRRGASPDDTGLDFRPLEVPALALDPVQGEVYTIDLAGPLEPGIYTYRLRLVRADGSSLTLAPVTVTVAGRGAVVHVFPNPFSDFATVEVLVGPDLIGGDRGVEVTVYDVLGRRVARLFDGDIAINGGVRRTFSGRDLAAGPYFVRVIGEKFKVTRTVTRVR